MKIRKANLSDVDFLLPLYSDLGYPTERVTLEKRLTNLFRKLDYGCLIAEHEGFVLGFVGYAKMFFFEADGRYYRILALSVLKEARRQGVATQLINAVKELAMKEGAKALALNSGVTEERQAAYQFYENVGFQKVTTGFALPLESVT